MMMTDYYTTTATTTMTTTIRRPLGCQQQHRRLQQQQQRRRKTFFLLTTRLVVVVSLLLPFILLLMMSVITAATEAIPNTTDNTYDSNDNDNNDDADINILYSTLPENIIPSSFKQPPPKQQLQQQIKQRNSQQQRRQQRRTVQQQQQQRPNKPQQEFQKQQHQEYNNNNYRAFISLKELQNAVDIVLEYRSTGHRHSFVNNNDNKKKQALLSSTSTTTTTVTPTFTPITPTPIMNMNTINDINDWYGPIELWNVSLLTDYTRLFNIKRNPHYVGNYNSTYDLDLSLWNIGGGHNTDDIIVADMFYGCTYMNFNVGLWNTSKVSQFQGMFELTTTFQGIGLEHWDVSSGIMFMSMFSSATGLLSDNNLDLSNWKPGLAVYQVQKQSESQSQSPQSRHQISFKNMFRDSSYSGNLCNWKQTLDPSNVNVNIEVEGMFSGSHCTNQNDPTFTMTEATTGGMNRNFIKKWDPTTSFCSDPCRNIDESESVVHCSDYNGGGSTTANNGTLTGTAVATTGTGTKTGAAAGITSNNDGSFPVTVTGNGGGSTAANNGTLTGIAAAATGTGIKTGAAAGTTSNNDGSFPVTVTGSYTGTTTTSITEESSTLNNDGSFPTAINGRHEGTLPTVIGSNAGTTTTPMTESSTSSTTAFDEDNNHNDSSNTTTGSHSNNSNAKDDNNSNNNYSQEQEQDTGSSDSSNSNSTSKFQKPNILLIMTDQQRFDTIRYIQDTLRRYDPYYKIQTPNLDLLLQSGVYFKNAYCQCPVCGPSRTSLRTGCTIERTGIQHNDLITEYNSMNNGQQKTKQRVEQLQSIDEILVDTLGYNNSGNHYYGKFHMPDVLAKSITTNDYDYVTKEHYFKLDSNGQKLRRYLQHSASLGEIQSLPVTTESMLEGEQLETYSEQPYYPIDLDTRSRYSSITNTPLKRSEGFESYEISQSNQMGVYAHPYNYTSTFYTGDIANKALKKLLLNQKQQQQQDGGGGGGDNFASSAVVPPLLFDPWFLTVSFHSPHPPMIPSWEYLEKYWRNQHNLFTPQNKNENTYMNEFDNRNSRNQNENFDHMSDTSYSTITRKIPEYASDELIKEWTAIYYALIEEIDTQVGLLLNTLDSNDSAAVDDDGYIKNNTLIVFTSDHGEMLGSHGKRDKNNFFEESSRVPLFMSYPSHIQAGTEINDMVGHIDVFATILDYATSSGNSNNNGINNNNSDGNSLRPLIENREVNEQYDNNVAIVEWDFRKPIAAAELSHQRPVVGSSDPFYLADRTIDERPAYLVRKGSYKLMIQKLASSKELDMMYNLDTDPFEVHNLIGNKFGHTIDRPTISKAEHLRCLLLDWMIRHNNNNNESHENYFSDPLSNFGQGTGDINEIRTRQSWKQIGFWVSDTHLNFDSIAWNNDANANANANPQPSKETLPAFDDSVMISRGEIMSNKPPAAVAVEWKKNITSPTTPTITGIRHEYLYLGSREEYSVYDLISVKIVGDDSIFFRTNDTPQVVVDDEIVVPLKLPIRIPYMDCFYLRISFYVDETNIKEYFERKKNRKTTAIIMDAFLVLSITGGRTQEEEVSVDDIWIELHVDDS